jgi:adenylate kinase family enzyme
VTPAAPAHRVHILGASGAGTTTLARALADDLAIPAFDADDYFWVKTDPPVKAPVLRIEGDTPVARRLSLVKSALGLSV